MAVIFKDTPRGVEKGPVEFIDESGRPIEGDNNHAQGIIREVISVNAVAGLRDIILRQRERCDKLAEYEFMYLGILPEYTKELGFLKELYNDVIRFQTNAGVMKLLQQSNDDGGNLSDGIIALEKDFVIQKQVADATVQAMKLLGLDTVLSGE